jgi:hypothetical protein
MNLFRGKKVTGQIDTTTGDKTNTTPQKQIPMFFFDFNQLFNLMIQIKSNAHSIYSLQENRQSFYL